jgi:hypothetical protein
MVARSSSVRLLAVHESAEPTRSDRPAGRVFACPEETLAGLSVFNQMHGSLNGCRVAAIPSVRFSVVKVLDGGLACASVQSEFLTSNPSSPVRFERHRQWVSCCQTSMLLTEGKQSRSFNSAVAYSLYVVTQSLRALSVRVSL